MRRRRIGRRCAAASLRASALTVLALSRSISVSIEERESDDDEESETRHTPVGRKGIRFLFRNPAAEPHTIRALVRVFVGVTQNDLETPSGDPGRVFFSV